MNKLIKAVITGLLVTSAGLASAVPLNGGVSFSSVDTSEQSWDAAANHLHIEGPAAVDDISGDFMSYLNIGDAAHFSDIDYNMPFTPASIWSTGNLSFTLEALTTAQETSLEPGDEPFALVLAGTGTLTDGVDSTPGYWNMSVNTAGNTFSWSSSAEVDDHNVPEPASMSLLCLALLGFHMRKILKNNSIGWC